MEYPHLSIYTNILIPVVSFTHPLIHRTSRLPSTPCRYAFPSFTPSPPMRTPAACARALPAATEHPPVAPFPRALPASAPSLCRHQIDTTDRSMPPPDRCRRSAATHLQLLRIDTAAGYTLCPLRHHHTPTVRSRIPPAVPRPYFALNRSLSPSRLRLASLPRRLLPRPPDPYAPPPLSQSLPATASPVISLPHSSLHGAARRRPAR
jgi:hypothetical protein